MLTPRGNAMASYFSPEAQILLHEGRLSIQLKHRDLQAKYFARAYKTDRGREYAHHGFCRRLNELARAIGFVFELLPPEQDDIPDTENVVAATMFIQSFFLNASGCLDNLAWIWAFETDLRFTDGRPVDQKSVGLGPRHWYLRNSFSKAFRKHLKSRKRWFAHLEEFRDTAAHRIPLYIPPYIIGEADAAKHAQLEVESAQAMQQGYNEKYDRLRSEQKSLGKFRPWMNHSLTEKSPTVVFHQQLLDDYETIEEFGQKILGELALFDEKQARAKQSALDVIKSKLRSAQNSIQALICPR
jgi:hypothetical protein